MDDTKPLTVTDAASAFTSPVSTKTVLRRIKRGCRGVRLKAVKDGGKWYTTARWIREFQEECTQRAMPYQPVLLPRRSADAARRRLRDRWNITTEV